ncbi:MAG: NCS2 family permease [Planctomycetes bacterium]|nr:NCS2 family permease [Planctomycetota bacterium]
MSEPTTRAPIWVRGDLDGFFGLMIDNLVQVLLIIDLCKYVAGLSDELIFGRILPGVAVSLLIGNVFYGLQARMVARRQQNPTCTALPYGINTPSVIAYALFIMGPVYRSTGSGEMAWLAGLFACLVSGVIEFSGAFLAEKLRRHTPRAALLGVLAAVGITFIAADFAFRIFTQPLVAMLPLGLLLLAYFARFRFPYGLPGGFLAVLAGSIIAWVGVLCGAEATAGLGLTADRLGAALGGVHWTPPVFVGAELWRVLQAQPDLVLNFLAVSAPMGYLNVLGSLQNIESAEAGGDRFSTAPSLAVNGLGTLAAGLFGSCFPTTIYIGHPGWKALGARSGYSTLNGLFFTVVFLLGLGPFVAAMIPIEAGAAIVVYIGIIITAQAFQATPREHAPAVAIALFPALGALLVITLANYLGDAGAAKTLADLLGNPTPKTMYLPGLLAITGANSSWILLTLMLSAIGAMLIDRRYFAACGWAATAGVLTLVGAMHSYRLEGNTLHELFIWQAAPQAGSGVAASRAIVIAVGYALMAALFGWAGWHTRRQRVRAGAWDTDVPRPP